MMTFIAIDPGNIESAYLIMQNGQIDSFDKIPNERLLHLLVDISIKHLAIEMIQSFGMPVGASVFETCVWIGRFIERFNGPYTFVYRKDVKMHLCGSMKAKDGNIRQALIDRYGEQGTKKNQGATYGIKADVWSALAVATYWMDTYATT